LFRRLSVYGTVPQGAVPFSYPVCFTTLRANPEGVQGSVRNRDVASLRLQAPIRQLGVKADAPPRWKRPLPDGMNPRGARKTAKSERRRAPSEAFWLFSEKILEKPCSEGMRCTASLLGGAFFCARSGRSARPTGSIVRSPGKNRPPEPASWLHTPPGSAVHRERTLFIPQFPTRFHACGTARSSRSLYPSLVPHSF
jgi:hypothetical protein